MLETLRIFASPEVVLAGIGLILVTSSFISGLQLIKGVRGVERKIHRFNGYCVLSIYIVLAILSFARFGARPGAIIGWPAGLSFIFFKLWIVKTRKRAMKYVPWLGVMLVLMWLYVLYTSMRR